MVHKRAVRKQQDTSRPPLDHLRELCEAFNTAAAQSAAGADPEAVHRVRTGSRRLQATIEATLREAGPAADGLERPARAYLRPLKHIRRAAGTVRDLDVQRRLLETLLETGIAEQAASPIRTQAEALDAWMKSERKRLARGMQKQIRKRQQGLAERQAALLSAIADAPVGRTIPARTADAVALDAFVRASDAMPSLDAENLHDFRKAIKKARYVAESGGAGPSGVAKALKGIQDVIGEWHDWLCLSEDAKAAINEDAPELSAALRREAAHHYAAAMTATQSLRGKLLGEWMAAMPAKRPSAAVAVGVRRTA